MKYGVFTVSLPEYSPEEAVKVLKELGYEGIEWRIAAKPQAKPAEDGKEPEPVPFERRYWAANRCTIDLDEVEEQAAHLKEICDAEGIEIFSLTTYLTPKEVEKAEKVMRAAASIGVPKIRIFQDGYHNTPDQKHYRVLMNEIRADIARLEILAKRYGVKVMLELHMDTVLASPSSAAHLLAGFDPAYIGVIFDPGNMVNEGFENYRKSFELLGPYIAHIHVKNAAFLEDGRDEFGGKKWKRYQAELWDGIADLAELFRVMEQFGYDGTVSMEDFSNERPTYEKLAKNLEYVKKLEAAAKQA